MLSFETKAEALEFLRSKDTLDESQKKPGIFWSSGTYVLNHGEYDRPEYLPRRYKDGWGIHVKHFYYVGTFYAPEDGRLEMDIWDKSYVW